MKFVLYSTPVVREWRAFDWLSGEAITRAIASLGACKTKSLGVAIDGEVCAEVWFGASGEESSAVEGVLWVTVAIGAVR